MRAALRLGLASDPSEALLWALRFLSCMSADGQGLRTHCRGTLVLGSTVVRGTADRNNNSAHIGAQLALLAVFSALHRSALFMRFQCRMPLLGLVICHPGAGGAGCGPGPSSWPPRLLVWAGVFEL